MDKALDSPKRTTIFSQFSTFEISWTFYVFRWSCSIWFSWSWFFQRSSINSIFFNILCENNFRHFVLRKHWMTRMRSQSLLWKHCETSCWKGVTRCSADLVRATCLATALRDKLHEKSHRVTGPKRAMDFENFCFIVSSNSTYIFGSESSDIFSVCL